MSAKILTSDVIGIDAFCQNPAAALAQSEQGAIAVFANNTPAFYAVSPARLSALLAMEASLKQPASDVTLDDNLYHQPAPVPMAVPPGKFAMYSGWQPDADFQRMAALWGIALNAPVTPEELSAFVAYWQAEGKVFHHVQWQQKLARSLQIGRGGSHTRGADINQLPRPDYTVPKGFRG
ncbi:primosomal protein 1 [Salmonella enterica subsp. enterica serovar Choleraesuis]|nr:primosomal protein 1 [Salmonella enterica subsp. enterica serovar Choleraesuis]